MPKELTPARRGSRVVSHFRVRVLTLKGEASKSMAGFGAVKCRVAGSVRSSSASTALMRLATPAAVSVCPMFVLTEPSATVPSAAVSSSVYPSRNARVSAVTSMGSPTGVPVPCASTYEMSPGYTSAAMCARRMTSAWPLTPGAV